MSQEAQVVKWNCPCGNLYTFRGFTEAKPQRQWVGLTDEEHMILYTKADGGLHDWAKAIEAKLKEKNT